ncbi:uncharacterized protein LOC6585668 [Drosophila mojavensis]|uniref:uncharacterized protein LOC6585668 n=1 Tax=Drosophila mojavensis TaxID=7230 RepID=UPI00017CAEBB|nr:uncharacterized protein LOC6585668 [Drosophila mojavensis]
MLKWAVNQPRLSYLETQPDQGEAAGGHAISSYSDFQPTATPTPIAASRMKLNAKRQSLLHIQMQVDAGDKENQLTSTLTSTPLPAASAAAAPPAPRCTPLLRDLSNILSPLHTPPLKRTAYACTLPTFEAEYSPGHRENKDQADSQRDTQDNRIIPGALLALRGMGIPDSYFEKPRYLQPAASTPAPAPSAASAAAPAVAPIADQTLLSSTQMGDVTLERMIDAILESTRKAPSAAPRARARPHPHPHPRSRLRHISRPRPAPLPPISTSHSPTYRPAFDPASDLSEYWQPPTHPDVYEEREVRSPQQAAGGGGGAGDASLSLAGKRRSLQQLRRQRVVRRKRKIATKISSSVRHSAQKLLAAAARSAHKLPHPHAHAHSHSRAPGQRHISPDSGHNSTSDCELELELEMELELEHKAKRVPFGDCVLEVATKRRLSFSFHEELFVEQ